MDKVQRTIKSFKQYAVSDPNYNVKFADTRGRIHWNGTNWSVWEVFATKICKMTLLSKN